MRGMIAEDRALDRLLDAVTEQFPMLFFDTMIAVRYAVPLKAIATACDLFSVVDVARQEALIKLEQEVKRQEWMCAEYIQVEYDGVDDDSKQQYARWYQIYALERVPDLNPRTVVVDVSDYITYMVEVGEYKTLPLRKAIYQKQIVRAAYAPEIHTVFIHRQATEGSQ